MKFLFFIYIYCFFICSLNAQSCIPDHFAYYYKTNSAIYAGKSIYTKSNDIVLSGAILKENGEFNDATDGMLTVMTARGTLLWSKRFEIFGYNTGYLSSIENATDSTFLVTGSFFKVKKNYTGMIEILSFINVLFKLDKYGNVIWTKRFKSFSVNEFINSITKLNNGNFLLIGSTQRDYKNQVLLMLINPNGELIKKEIIFNEKANFYQPYVFKTINNNLVLIGNCNKETLIPNTNFYNKQFGYYFLNVTNDLIIDNVSNLIMLNAATSGTRDVFEVRNALQLQGDTIMIGTNFSGETSFGAVPYSKMGMLLKATSKGKFISAKGLYNTSYGCKIVDIALISNEYQILMDDGYKSMMFTSDDSLNIHHAKTYPGVFSLTEAGKLFNNINKNSILYFGRSQVPLIGLVKTESDNSLPCLDANASINSENLTNLYNETFIQISKRNQFSNDIETQNFPLNITNFSLTKNIDCYASCCNYINRDTTKLDLCNVTSYTLPWNETVSNSGIYYKKLSSINNCDSIIYFDIRFSKPPIIDIDNPVCLGNDSIKVLQLSNTYPSYIWNNTPAYNNSFSVTLPGLYNLQVSNSCGTINKQIEVFKDCDFPIYFPNIFTPNNDGVNDFLYYPTENKNKFASIKIYNKYGQKIYYSKDLNWKWDGKTGVENVDLSVYVYQLEVITPLKTQKIQKGTIVLIR